MSNSIQDVFTGERFVPGIEDEKLTIEHYQRYVSIKELVKDKIVVDAACGEGYGSDILSQYAKKVTGLDIDADAVDRANMAYASDKVNYIVGDVTKLPFEDNSVEVFVSFETIEHIPEAAQNEFLKEINRVLKEDGFLIMSTPNKKVYSDDANYNNEFHIKEFYKKEFVDFLAQYFPNVKLFNQYFEVAGIIDSNMGDDLEAKYAKNIQKYNFDGKYFVGIASKRDISELKITSVFLSEHREYEGRINRILQLQDEVEARNLHIKNLDAHIEELDSRIVYYENYRMEVERFISEEDELMQTELVKVRDGINSKIEKLNNKINELESAKNEYENYINVIKVQLEDKSLHIRNIEALLYEKEENIRTLSNIIDDKDNHIKNIQPYYEKWIAIENSKMTRFKRLPKQVVRKSVNTMFPKGSQKRRGAIAINHTVRRSKLCKAIFPYGKKGYINIGDDYNRYGILQFESCNDPVVSIIIPAYNQVNYTYLCLQSILVNTKGIKYEIIIADDVSSDGTKRLGNFVKNIKIIRNKKNLKFLLNCNNAAKQAKGKYILFLNNDTVVTENWLQPLVDLIESADNIGMVGSKLIYPDGRLQEAGGIIWKDASAWNYGNGDNPDLPQYNYVREADYISGASIMIRTDLWRQIGGFDERYAPAYCEDSDLAFEVRAKGYKVLYQPQSVVVHFEGISNGTDISNGLKQYQVINNIKLREKWADELINHYANGEHVVRAGDRAFNKKVILIIDHYVPTFDKDAGSKTVFQYIKLFLAKGFVVKFIGDNYCNCEPYTTVLTQMGVEVLYGNWFANNIFTWLKDNNDSIDYVFMNRPHITEKYIDFFNVSMNAKIIYYGHDLHFLRIAREYELTKEMITLKDSEYWKEKELGIMKKADVSYYPSYIESEYVKNINPEINVKALIPYVFDTFEPSIRGTVVHKGILFVGGFSHTPNVDAVLWFVKEIYPLIKAKANIPFYIVGSNPPQEILDLHGDGIDVKGFVSDEELEKQYLHCKLVVVPLRYGAGVKGKVIEAIYNGVPMVTTSIGAEGIRDIEDILIVEDEATQFANRVLALYKNNEQLEAISSNMKKYIKAHYSIETAWDIIKEEFE